MNIEQKDTYFVAVKMFLERDGKLLILKDNFDDWDLPGGRIKKDEFEKPLDKIIERKISEELGDHIKYKIGQPIVFMRHERVEATPGNPTVRIFAIGYAGTLEFGEIKTSERHPEFLWVDPKNFKPEDYFKGGWLHGVKEYLAIRNRCFKVLTVHGRFQPPLHINHWDYISKAFEMAERVIILITNPYLEEMSVPEAEHRNRKENNPFTYDQRVRIFKSFFDLMGISKDKYEFRPFEITNESAWNQLDKNIPNLVNMYEDWSRAKFEKFQSKGLQVIRLDIPKTIDTSGTKIRKIIFKNISPEEKREELIETGYMKEAIPGLFEVLGYK